MKIRPIVSIVATLAAVSIGLTRCAATDIVAKVETKDDAGKKILVDKLLKSSELK